MSKSDAPDAPGEHSSSPIHERLNHAKEVLEAGGLELPGVSPFLFVWKKFGIKGLLFIILFVGFPAGEYSALRYAVYSGLPRTVGGFGLTFTAEEWSLSPLKMRAVARNVRVSTPSGKEPVLTAGEIEFQGSAWTLLRGLPDMLTFHMFGGTQPFNEIVVRHGELRLERSLTGHLNWTDVVAAVPQARFADAVTGVYRVNELELEDFRVTYTEHLPGGSSDGVIRSAQAEVKLDEVRGTISDLAPPEESGQRPTRFKLNGRAAAGVFEVAGSAALFHPNDEAHGGADSGPGTRTVSFEPAVSSGLPFEVSVYLENIGAAAYGQMVPVSTIVPVNGLINGRTNVVHNGQAPSCSGGFTMTDVRFAPNPRVVTNPSDADVIKRLVSDLVYTGPFELCGAQPTQWKDDAPDRPAAFALARLTEQATASASPGVKALVDRDRRIMGGEPVESTLSALTTNLAQQMGLRLAGTVGGAAGRAVAQSLVSSNQGTTSSSSSTGKGAGQAVMGGVKSVGSGIKRLFGGGSKKK
jgi:hypothetical protein